MIEADRQYPFGFEDFPIQTETVSVDPNLQILGIPIDHFEQPSLLEKEQIQTIIHHTDGLIVEYFPDEIRKIPGILAKISSAARYNDIINFYGQIVDFAAQQSKPVYVLDPAYDKKFGMIRALSILNMTAGIRSTVSVGRDIADAIGDDKIESREEFLKSSIWTMAKIGITAQSAAMFLSWVDETYSENPHRLFYEAEIRRVIVARGINNIAEKNQDNESLSLGLMYPPVHWEGIRDLLEDDKRLSREFKIITPLKQIPIFNKTFFAARQYLWDSEEWNLSQKNPIY